MIRLEERFNNYYDSLTESVKNVYEFLVIAKDDSTFRDTIEAYSWKQAKYLAQEKYKGRLIRDVRQITDNKEPEDENKQISMFED